MRARIITLATWLLMATGSYLTCRGLLEYRESRAGQQQIAQEWNSQSSAPTIKTLLSEGATQADPSPAHVARQKPKVNAPEAGAAVAKLTFPTLDTVLYVVEGTSDHDLKRGPGHVEGTVLPGEDGNCVIAGHRDTHFRILKDIHKGDEVILERAGDIFRYRVDGMQIVSPQNTSSLRPTDKAELNLITCYPFHYVGSAPKRFIVHAGLEGSALQAAR